MPVPTRRLIFLSLWIFPVVVALHWSPAVAGPMVLLGMILTGLVLLDSVQQGGGACPLIFEEAGETRLAKHREGEWVLRFQVNRAVSDGRVGLAFPAELGAEMEEERLQGLDQDGSYKITWPMRPRKRGRYELQQVFVAASSKWGFWEHRWQVPLQICFQVHPDLHRERNTMANLFLNRGQAGMRAQRISGKGRDYDQIREYRPGDTLGDIHWKATAKRNSLMAKSHQIERTQEVYIVVDHSRLSGRPQPFDDHSETEPLLERFVAAANVLAMAALREGDLFGFMAFARTTDRYLRAGSGTAHLRALQNQLFQLESEAVYPDIDEWVRTTRTRLRRRSLLILLTDLSDATTFELLEQRIGLLSRTHLVVVAMIPMPGVRPLFDGSGETDPWRGLAGHLMWRDLAQYRKRLHAQGVPLLLPTADRLAADVVDQYLGLKQQQLL